MGGIARLRRSYVARRPLIDPAVRLRQKSAPSRLRNSQYGAWFVLDEVQNNRCGGVYAPDRSQPRKRNLFTYLNEFAASIPREEKQRTLFLLLSRLIPGSPLVYKYSRASGSPSLNHPPPSLASLHHWLRGAPQRLCHVGAAASHALGALTAVVGIGVGGDVSEPLNMAGALDAGISAGAPRDWGALFSDAHPGYYAHPSAARAYFVTSTPGVLRHLSDPLPAPVSARSLPHRSELSSVHITKTLLIAVDSDTMAFACTRQTTLASIYRPRVGSALLQLDLAALTLFKVCYYAPYFSAERPKRLPLLWPYTTLDFELEQGLELRCVREDFEQLPVEGIGRSADWAGHARNSSPNSGSHGTSSRLKLKLASKRNVFRAHALRRRRKTSRRLPSPNKSARGAAAASSAAPRFLLEPAELNNKRPHGNTAKRPVPALPAFFGPLCVPARFGSIPSSDRGVARCGASSARDAPSSARKSGPAQYVPPF
ncbi:hypothetical protein B0H15DRAFT_946253 [Mycena belliarum]|uniref:Uncharacterized protein n=1 Tax=Mycena belliarum TaxID=1033014 RepID=A0AAD6XU06_9AGAR|nr:hypothetical protein B0H15DRAFT_946253 [Mycena belliae]